MLALLPEVANATVLDAGCGSGWYVARLLERGARVTAFDLNPELVALTRARVGDRARVLRANLAEPLTFAADQEFDLIVCPLVLHYLLDWRPALRELCRILKPGGTLLFSTHHPFMDWTLFKTGDYFAVELLHDQWDVGEVSYYRRPLTEIADAVSSAGLWIERLVEPQPTDDFKRVDPEGYERVTRNPWFLIVRALKPSGP